MPFVIGLLIAMIFRRLIDYIENKLHINRTITSIIILILLYGCLGFIISMIGFKVFTFVVDIVKSLPSLYSNTIEPAFNKATKELIKQFPGIEDQFRASISSINDTILSYLTTISSKVISISYGLAGQLPSLLIKLIFTIVSSFFFTIDYYKITNFLLRQFSGKQKDMILNLKDNGIGTLVKFFKAYSTIITITFIELSLGFWIIGIPTPYLFGAIVALIDIMPIIGTGAVLLPWSMISFIIGNTKIGIGMLLLYIVVTIIRQTIEPKIVGQQIGLHPILTLILMFVGAQLMGVLGLLILPIIATIIKKLNDEGTIHLFK